MSDASQGPGWWQASDGKWYPPQPPMPPPPYPAPPSFPPTSYPPPGMYPSPGTYPAATTGYQVYGQPGFGRSGLPSVQGLAIASLVLGICGIVLCFCSGFISGGLGIVGLPLGIVALRRITKGEADPGAKGLAIAGVACSGVALALGAVGIVLLVAIAGSSTS